jgi:hypothetical protein
MLPHVYHILTILVLQRVLARIRPWYYEDRLHSALGYLPPMAFYRGDPPLQFEVRRVKLFPARHRHRDWTQSTNSGLQN